VAVTTLTKVLYSIIALINLYLNKPIMSDYSPELIPACKETQLIRFQSRVVGLTTPARRHSMKIINLCLLVFCVLSGLVGILYLGFDPLVRSIVLKNLVLSNTSSTFHIWEDPPISPHLKVYFFNLTNPVEVFDGREKPRLVEVGPYTYQQQWLKQNITWHDNGTISYKTRKIFTFNANASCSGCDERADQMTTIDIPVISAYLRSQAKFDSECGWGCGWRGAANGVIIGNAIYALGGKRPWITKSVHDMLWGYDEILFTMAEWFDEPPPFEQFALFPLKNSSRAEDMVSYTMYTGEGDPYMLSTIHSIDGKSKMDHWNSSQCNKVHGSDGASFNPYIKKDDTLWFFNDQLCRAMPLVYKQQENYDQLPGYRFIPREDVFKSSESYPENSCYAGTGREDGDGVFDVTVCQFDTPIVLSWPHFLNADPKYQAAIQGLSPNVSKHGFWFDIQPVTGTTLSAKARIQINMNVRRMENFADLSKINDTVFPLIWFEEGIDELGTELINVLKQAATDPNDWKNYILYVWIGMLSTLVVLGLVAVARVLANRASVARVERVREQVESILAGGQTVDRAADCVQPMLGLLESTDSSRASSSTHSRTSSEGQQPLYTGQLCAASPPYRPIQPYSGPPGRV